MADPEYRDTIFSISAGARSAADLDWRGRMRLIDHLADLKRRQHSRANYPGRPHSVDDNPQLQKIEALLTDQHLPWSYADGIAKRMYGKDRVGFCAAHELSAVITALTKRQAKQ